MATLPSSGYLSDNVRTEGEMKGAFEDLRDFVEQLIGGNGEGGFDINASGLVSPAQGVAQFTVDTNADASADDLDNIATANFEDGNWILVRQEVASRDVTMRHNQGGDGQLDLLGGSNFTFGETDIYSLMRMRAGSPNQWDEITRFYGRTAESLAALRTYIGLGTAAVLNFGTGSDDLPKKSQIVGAVQQWYGAEGMTPRQDNGCQSFSVDPTTAGSPDIRGLKFSSSVQQYAQWSDLPPKGWNGGTITFFPVWAHLGGQTGGLDGAVWGLRARALSHNDSIDVAHGTFVNNASPFDQPSAETETHGGVSAAVTVQGTPAVGDRVEFEIARRVGDASDDLDVEAILIGVLVTYTFDKLNDN